MRQPTKLKLNYGYCNYNFSFNSKHLTLNNPTNTRYLCVSWVRERTQYKQPENDKYMYDQDNYLPS